MHQLRTTLLASLVALGVCTGGRAASITLVANLTNASEVPTILPSDLKNSSTGAVRPPSSGTATFVLDTTDPTHLFMTFSAMIFNIDVTGTQTPNDTNDNLVNAHIHAGANVAPGVNGPVVWGFFGSPYNDTNPDDSINTTTPPLHVIPFSTGVGGTFGGKWDFFLGGSNNEGNGAGVTLSNQMDFILSGRSYINFHTSQFTGGEIRGFLVASVPEPSSIVLLGIGALSAIGCGWRFRQR